MRWVRVGLAVLSVVAFAGAAEGEGVGDDSGIRVMSGGPDVMIRRYHLMPWRALGAGTIAPRADLRCEKECTLRIDPTNTLTLAPGSSIVDAGYFFVPLESGKSLVRAHRVELHEGRLLAVSRQSPSALPMVVAVPGDGLVVVSTGEAQIAARASSTAVGAHAGLVRLGANHSWVTLPAGNASVIALHSLPTPALPLPTAPMWVPSRDGEPSSIEIAKGDAPAEVGGRWTMEVPGQRFQIELTRPGAPGVVETLERTDPWFSTGPRPAGTYVARVRGIDAEGLEGPTSVARALRVVALSLPPSATFDASSHAVVAPEGGEIGISDPRDLELAMDGGGFSLAPTVLHVDSRDSHGVRLRLKDDPASVGAFVLEKRALRADVSLTPRHASWPSDPIDIRVDFRDPKGRVDASTVDPRVQVLIDTHEVPIEWQHHGSTWQGRLPPRNLHGPTVVRVIATDQFGATLGRNFLEVDSDADKHSPTTPPRSVARN